MAEAVKNYTEAQVATIVEEYSSKPSRVTVERLAKEMGKTNRSIIAKLSREGVYIAPKPATKSGLPIVRKSDIVKRIEVALGRDIEAPSLIKVTKLDLLMLEDAIIKATS